MLTSLASAGIGLFFLGATTAIQPPLAKSQKWLLLISLVSMGATVHGGVYSWYCDSRRSYLRAKALVCQDGQRRRPLFVAVQVWQIRFERANRLMRASFLCGVFAALVYVFDRVV